MSGGRFSPSAQTRFMLQWFQEWSELQRQDFLPILAVKMSRRDDLDDVVNSIAAVNCDAKPMSLFQCRIKLFNEWFPSWTEEDLARLVRDVTDVDPAFAEKLEQEVQTAHQPNGITNGTHDAQETNGIHDINGDTELNDEIAHKDGETKDHTPDKQEEEKIIPNIETVQENMMPLPIVATS